MRGLWWLLALAILVTGSAGTYMVHLVLEAKQKPRIGDGSNPATYGFSFEYLTVPMNEIQASGLPRNSLDVLDLPPRYSAEEATHFRGRDKYVVATDLILGVELGDEALAYPIQILNWHEVVNDTLAGVPIVVSYSPLTGTIAAFDRRVGDQTLEFGFSGLLLETHSLLFDRSDEPSLWSPLLGRAISGPAAARGDTLRPIHAQFVPWSVWSKRHPEAEVLTRDEAKIMAYRRSPYGEYYGNDILRFPVSKLPPDRETYPYKSRIIAVRTTGDWSVYHLADLVRRADPRGIYETTQDGVDLRFTVFSGDPITAYVEAVDPTDWFDFRPTMWFAWYSVH